jgi:hypothetical protein
MGHKSRVHNVVVDVSSRRHLLLTNMQVEVIGFKVLKDLYKHDDDFSKI